GAPRTRRARWPRETESVRGAARPPWRPRGYACPLRKARTLVARVPSPPHACRPPAYGYSFAVGMSSRILYAPILHGSLPFAVAVRETFLRERPDCVAVELPSTLEGPVGRAVRRLPLLSVLRYKVS